MRYADWGSRSPRWAGIRSEETDVRGTAVHYLRADGEGTPHLLIHPMAGNAAMWLDVIKPMTALGPVIAPDLSGTLFGHTGSPHPRAARIEPNARFLRAFTARLGLERVIVHGWSMGALVGLFFSALAPERVERLVLVAPALPGPLPGGERLFWRTAGRALLATAPPLVRAALPLAGRRLIELKLRTYADPLRNPHLGGELARMSQETRELLADELRAARPERLAAGVTAFASVMSAVLVDPRPVHAAMDRVSAPTLVIWGGQDALVAEGTREELAARRPGWAQHVLETAGHALPLERPDEYVKTVGRWLGR
ncbi:alpha/beta hydrolase [Nonomuraea sp. NN258]|uniref:alpha/beta fold hydrolase n=1 Tax=Nonomuraea antri TaxID=2730852 RepID=UPI00156A3A26|nr:alpha/beta hydrolase [Nonomuraea antri]NRQ37886.1 alpha/beta hydrolase [Nonomuraea antri]